VQWVIRPQSDEYHDYRGYAGQIASGTFTPGDEIVVLPAGHMSTVASVETMDGPIASAEAPSSITIRLTDNIDVSRGDLIAHVADAPTVTREIEADVCWMHERPLTVRGRYVLRHTTREVVAIVDSIEHRVDIHSRGHEPADALALNDIGRVRIRTSQPLAVDPYGVDRETGSFILIDEATNETLGGAMVVRATPAS
jgi:bifunctional enzyme CysN/CysC